MQPTRWPLHPPPLAEESVLSWLGRIARCYRMNTKNLVMQNLGFDGPLEQLIVRLPPDLLSLLSIRTGVPEDIILAMTLSAWSPLLLDNLMLSSADFALYVDAFPLFLSLKNRNKIHCPKRLWWPWIRLRDTALIKACPYCVQEKPAGVISLAWYLCVLLSCPLHRCMLQYCKTYQGNFMCWMNKMVSIDSVPEPIAVMDKRTWAALTVGRVDLPDRAVHGAVWLRLLRALVDELHMPIAYGKRFAGLDYVTNVWSALGLSPRAGIRRWRPYEFLPNDVQDKTLLAAAVALNWIETGRVSLTSEQARWFIFNERNSVGE